MVRAFRPAQAFRRSAGPNTKPLRVVRAMLVHRMNIGSSGVTMKSLWLLALMPSAIALLIGEMWAARSSPKLLRCTSPQKYVWLVK